MTEERQKLIEVAANVHMDEMRKACRRTAVWAILACAFIAPLACEDHLSWTWGHILFAVIGGICMMMVNAECS